MLTSSASQYLHPGDYINPLPTTLDAKKSPLALLAQTCSSIGKDAPGGGPASKPIIPPLEKKDKDQGKEQQATKSTSSGDHRKTPESPSAGSKSPASGGSEPGRRSSHNPERPASKDGSSKSSFRTPPPKDIPPLVPIKAGAGGESGGSKTPTGHDLSSSKTAAASPGRSSSAGAVHSSSNSRISVNCGSLSLEVNHRESTTDTSSKSSGASSLPSHHHHLPTSKAGDLHAAGLLHPSYAALPLLGSAHSHHLAGLEHYSAGLAAHTALSSLSAHHKHAAGLSPYCRYTTVKTASGATTLVPVCADPYCSHCKLTLSSAQLSGHHGPTAGGCPATCGLPDHDKHGALPPTSLPGGSFPGLPGLPATSSLPGLYPGHFPGLSHHQAPGAGLPPYTCNWVAGADYCGKRFSTSEELLAHLRSHTSSTEAAAAAAAAAAAGLPPGYPFSSLPGAGLSSLAAASTHGSLSPNSALRAAAAYPGSSSGGRSLSPTSLLAAARYHPYLAAAAAAKSPGAPGLSVASSLPGGAPGSGSLPGLPPSLASAYYPYAAAAALYGQRLGAVAP